MVCLLGSPGTIWDHQTRMNKGLIAMFLVILVILVRIHRVTAMCISAYVYLYRELGAGSPGQSGSLGSPASIGGNDRVLNHATRGTRRRGVAKHQRAQRHTNSISDSKSVFERGLIFDLCSATR
jgi:hypothetical protein